MSMRESRKMRREARRATLGRVASAPSFKSVKKKASSKSRNNNRRAMLAGICLATVMVLLLSAPKAVHAAGEIVPEVDPGSMASAMTLLVGGVLALTGKVRRK